MHWKVGVKRHGVLIHLPTKVPRKCYFELEKLTIKLSARQYLKKIGGSHQLLSIRTRKSITL